jgi:hypothetical protein
MNLNVIRNSYISEGYDVLDASSKTCQDIILSKIAKSTLSKNVTIKGGVIIQHISNDKRRATRDFDFDFIKYSLTDNSIMAFIDTLNETNDGIEINIVAPIEELSHQEYHGKRVILELTDKQKNVIGTKLDIGVHNRLNIEQEEYCFELDSIDEHVTLLMNSKEQMFSEKLKSLLKHGRFSTRYKDLFDFYYFITTAGLNKDKLIKCISEFIFDEKDMREVTLIDIHKRLSSIFQNKTYLEKAGRAHNNWLELPIGNVTERILLFFKNDLVS